MRSNTLVVVVAMMMVPFASVASAQGFRGLWISNVGSDVYDSAASIDAAVARAKRQGLTAVYPVVWNKGTAFFRSRTVETVLGWTATHPFGERDVLAEVVAAGRRHGMAVVPWFEYGLKVPLAYVTDEGRKGTHVGGVLAGRGWLSRDERGSVAMAPEFGVEKGFLNPAHPEVRRFLRDVFAELAAYDVAGVMVDDHFSLHKSFGFDQTMRELQADAVPPAPTSVGLLGQFFGRPAPRAIGEVVPLNRTGDFAEFRRSVVADCLADVARVVREAGRRFVLCPGGGIDFSRDTWLQDWLMLAERNLVGEVIVQVYRRDLSSFERSLDDPAIARAAACVDVGVGILTGLKGQGDMPASLITDQARACLRRGLTPSLFWQGTLDAPATARGETAAVRARGMEALALILKP